MQYIIVRTCVNGSHAGSERRQGPRRARSGSKRVTVSCLGTRPRSNAPRARMNALPWVTQYIIVRTSLNESDAGSGQKTGNLLEVLELARARVHQCAGSQRPSNEAHREPAEFYTILR